jgi:hypothetical protein
MTSHLPGDLEGPSERLNVTKDPTLVKNVTQKLADVTVVRKTASGRFSFISRFGAVYCRQFWW